MQAPAEKVPPLHRMDPFGITLAVPQVRDLWVVISGDYPGLEHRRAQVWSPIICAQRMTEVPQSGHRPRCPIVRFRKRLLVIADAAAQIANPSRKAHLLNRRLISARPWKHI